MGRSEATAFKHRLDRIYLRYTVGFVAFVGLLAVLEQTGLPRRWIGVIFLLATVAASSQRHQRARGHAEKMLMKTRL